MDFFELCKRAKIASKELALLSSQQKNRLLTAAAENLIADSSKILQANKTDIENCIDKPAHFIDRLRLTKDRIQGMADGLLALCNLTDPIGEVMDEFINHCGLKISKVRVPLGVVGIIYEARPNVTSDAAGLCIKSGNSVILRGSKDAALSNRAISDSIRSAIADNNINPDIVSLVQDTSRESANLMMRASGYIDVLIPRGGAGLIKSVVENSTVPVIETGSGNCHIYVDATADYDMAKSIVVNAKVSRPSVCNACETLLIESKALHKFKGILSALRQENVQIRGCRQTAQVFDVDLPADDSDYSTEYNDYIIAVKAVNGIDEAIEHIERYSTHHSDAIVSSDPIAVSRFLNEVDSAAVYVNTSTRFTDGFEFGFGAEMGISTQKLHARGPMGLRELTAYKYRVIGSGQIRK